MEIAIAGTRYVGLSNAVLLAQHHEVVAVDVILANRRVAELDDVIEKLYTRDIFGFD